MSPAQAILAGAALIALSVIFVGAVRPAAALGNGPFQIEHHSNATANAGVFRLDTSSGEISYCFLNGTGGADIVCTKPVR